MKLRDVVQSGDWILVYPKPEQLLGKLIKKFTFGQVSHAALVVDKDTLFETDGDMFTAKFTSLDKYAGRHVIVIAPKSLKDREHDIKVRCEAYKGAPYSYWDIWTNLMFFWLAAPLRRKLIGLLGTKKFMLCSELVARITYDVGHHESLRTYEGVSPEDLRDIALENPTEYDYLDFEDKQ
jgi:hypothetical protein